MIGSRASLILATLLLLGSGALLLSIGNGLPLLVAVVAILVASMLRRSQGSSSAWIGSCGAIGIFLAGTPLTGNAPEGLLISAVMALYFVCFVQLLKVVPLHAASPSGPYTLTFYGTLLLAYILLQNRVFPFPIIFSIFLAAAFILTSLALWEMGRRSRLAQAGQLENPSLPDWLGRACILAALLLGTFLLFRLPLPWMANAALDVAQEMNLTAHPPSPKERGKGGKDQKEWDSSTDPLDPGKDWSDQSEDGDHWGRGRLPKQADLEPSDLARLHMKLPNKEQATRVLGKTLYVRAHTLGVYTKDGWERADYDGRWTEDADDGSRDGWVTFGQAPEEDVVHQRFYLYNHLRGGALLTLTNTLAIRRPQVFRQNDDFLSIREGGDVTYDIVSAPILYEDIAKEDVLEPGEAAPHLSEKAQGLTFRDMDNLLLGPAQTANLTLKQKLSYVRQLFHRNYAYSLRVENPDDRDPLANFLFHEKAGYCDFFAQAGAHMLRSLGVPSRVAYGYAGGLFDPAQELYTFRESDGHSWTEMFLKGHGWVIFDLVPVGDGPHRAAEVSPMGVEQGDPIRRFREAEEARQSRPANSPARPPSLGRDWEGWLEGLWIVRHLNLLLALTIAGLLISYLIRRWRRRGEVEDELHRAAARARTEPPGYFRDFCELFAKLGYQRCPGETLREFMAHLKESAQIRDEFDPLLQYHYAIEYEDGIRSKSQERRFRREIRDFAARTGG